MLTGLTAVGKTIQVVNLAQCGIHKTQLGFRSWSQQMKNCLCVAHN